MAETTAAPAATPEANKNAPVFSIQKIYLKDVSFEVKKGEIFGFLGAHGAGHLAHPDAALGFGQPIKVPPHFAGINREFQSVGGRDGVLTMRAADAYQLARAFGQGRECLKQSLCVLYD